jgi:hypothetical protein
MSAPFAFVLQISNHANEVFGTSETAESASAPARVFHFMIDLHPRGE